MKEENYFDKFVRDLEERVQQQKQRLNDLQNAEKAWEQRRALDRRYREHVHQRIRYNK
jgi:mRNA-degrading endonuclease YafQ of YafQ-DinJ toxin-antitoxin module